MSACPKCAAPTHDAGQRYCDQCGHDLPGGLKSTLKPDDKRRSIADEFDGLVGKVVDGRYKVLGRIGVGGMGIVYRVEHVRMGKVAAMKVLRRDLADDAQAAKRFVNEVEVVSRLEHPNIVQTFDFGEWHGLLYLVMELVRGEDLAVMVRRDGPLPLSRALPLFAQVCQALDEAHHAGVIHRDLKPDNIVVFRRREGEHVKVLDFGLAKLRERPALADVAGAGSLVGTPYYMAPEQVRSEPITERTDIYALGATIYRVVTGVPPFQGDTPMAILTRHLTEPVVPPSERREGLSLDVDHLVLKALAKDPANRFGSAAEMRDAINAVIATGAANPDVSQPLPSWVDSPSSGPVASPSSTSSVTKIEGRTDPIVVDDSDPAARLRREDIDSFERGIRWRRRLMGLLLPAALGAALWGGWRLYQNMGDDAGVTEAEPNNSAATANLPPNGSPLYGQIGEASEGGEPDFDYYRIPGGKLPRAVKAIVTGVPDVNLVLELFDVTGALVAKVDGGSEGRGEVLGPLALRSSNEWFLRVRPLWLEGDATPAPVAQAATPYMLTVEWGKPDADQELEPNDAQAKGNTLSFGKSLEGHIATGDDVDWYIVKGDGGSRFAVSLDADEKHELALEIPSAKKRLIASPNVIDDGLVMPAEGRVLLVVRENVRKRHPGMDRAAPYVLKVSRL